MSDTLTIRVFGDVQRQRIRQLADRVPDSWTVSFNPPRRSNEQNDLMWALIEDVRRAKPEGRVMDKDAWKALFMHDAGFRCTFEPSLDGQGVVPLGFKSSRLRKAEFSELIECIRAYGATHGVRWSDPAMAQDQAA